MLGVLVRTAGLMVLAPPTPVAWWPGARTLPDSVMRRLPRAIGRIAMPLDGGQPTPARVITAAEPEPVLMAAPWGEPASPFVGVMVSTRQVPLSWLRPEAPAGRALPMPVTFVPVASPPTLARHTTVPRAATITELPRAPRTMPQVSAVGHHGTIGRFRRAAALAVGLLVSLVAVEAAARSGRR